MDTDLVLSSDFSSRVSVPYLPKTMLSEEEAATAEWLARRLFDTRADFLLSGLYYDGLQEMTDLGISIPPELLGLRQVLGWAQTGVDARDERLTVQGFRLPSSTSADEDIWDMWQANNLDEESPLAHLDAMIYGSSYVVVGAGESKDAQPVITVESPLDMTMNWNPRTRKGTAAFQTYVDTDLTSETYGRQLAALYLIGSTIHMVKGRNGWEIIDRDDYDNLDQLPVVLMANRTRTRKRMGLSEITPAWRNTMDRACRTMLGMEVAREFFAAPQRWIMGAAEDAFQNADGSAVSAWQTYIGRITALEADDQGNLPQVGTWETGDPANFTKLLENERTIMASLLGVSPQYLGIFSDGNPASADAIRMSDFRLKMIADQKTVPFGGTWEDAVRIGLQIRDGKLPDDAHRLETDWAPTGIPTPAADTDAITKQIQVGSIPADSDVTLEKLGYSAVDRARLTNDRKRARGQSNLAALTGALKPAPVTTEQEPVPDGV